MICKSCGIKNKETATHCYGCGTILQSEVKQQKKHKNKNVQVDQFNKHKKRFESRLMLPVLGGVVLLIGFVFLIIPKGSPKTLVTKIDESSVVRLQSKTEIVATMDDKKDIVAQFICPCGKCKIIDDLKDCHCKHPGGAEAIKQFIYERIQENKYTPLQIVDMVSNKYGGRTTP
ncbi:MAG: hypothetical protein WCW40_00220 [Bacteroidota bacterium]